MSLWGDNWCRNSRGSYPNYWCAATNEYVSQGVVDRSCKNNGYDCDHYFVSTLVGDILGKDLKDDPALVGIRVLKNSLKVQEEYANLIAMYDRVGEAIVQKMSHDENKEELATKLYKVIEKVSVFVEKGKEEKATDNYCKMILYLVNKYNLHTFYNIEADFINRKNPDAKKVQKLAKTIEK